MRVAFITLGCKVNSYESDAIANLFASRGAQIVDSKDSFDACVINTCSVTNQATAKSRKLIRSAIRTNPNAIIAVMGCYSQMAADEIKAIDGVDIVLGNANKQEIVDLVYEKQKNNEIITKIQDILKYKTFEKLSPINFNRTRAFLKIEDGCNNFCSYCIIPYTRGPIRSKKAEDVINDINNIVANGYKEIVLTGIHTGKYYDAGLDFTGLVKRILNETKVERLRISSIELNEITDEFLELMKENTILADHLHLPLQAGSNHVLKLMNRHYTREEYIEKIKQIRLVRPQISITTDIIVGFPEESDVDFEDTISLCKEVQFAKIHAFPFSLRAGTKACEFKQVSEQVKSIRMERLLLLDQILKEEYYKRFLDTLVDIIIEEQIGDYLVGHSSNYLPVNVPYYPNLLGKKVTVLIQKIENDKIYGKLSSCN